MPTLTAGNTVYTHPMAKVMISIPDDLLGRLDAQARSNQETRSGFLQRLAERELNGDELAMRADVERMLGELNIAIPADDPAQGDIVRAIREGHEDRDRR